MSWCCAVNCKNSHTKGFKLYRFPSELRNGDRRKVWIQNCRRKDWKPSVHSVLCEVHFEESQFESNRSDGLKKLKQTAIPTLFNVPNPPQKLDTQRVSKYKNRITPHTAATNNCNVISVPPATASKEVVSSPIKCTVEVDHSSLNKSLTSLSQNELIKLVQVLSEKNEELLENIKSLQSNLIATCQKREEEIKNYHKTVAELQKVLDNKNEQLKSFLTNDQVKSLSYKIMPKWDPTSIIKGLKFRYMLGVSGYQFLVHESGYPLPSYSTLNRHIEGYTIQTGILENLLGPLKTKITCMSKEDRICSLSIDEMQISCGIDYQKHKREVFGMVTLGNCEETATHLLLAVIRGVRNKWKQVIALEFTSSSTKAEHFKVFIEKCIKYVEDTGLYVLSLSSDMGNTNQALWTTLGVYCKKDGMRSNSFTTSSNGHPIFVMPDVCHLLKNLKSSLLSQDFTLPDDVVKHEGLPTNKISAQFIKNLWHFEVNSQKSLRTFHHLKPEDLAPSNFDKMRVGPAVRFFSNETAAGLELAVACKILPDAARTTAWFIRYICDWFTMVSSRVRKKSITRHNKGKKHLYLTNFIHIFQCMLIGSNSWKPLNWGMILSAMSIIDITNLLLQDKLLQFVLLSRFTQDGIENVFSQVRRRAGMTPTAVDCMAAIRQISLSQFISDVKNSNYCDASDKHLLNHFSSLKSKNEAVDTLPSISELEGTISAENTTQPHVLETVIVEDPDTVKMLLNYDLNLLYNISGCVTNALLGKKYCETCKEFIVSSNLLGGEHFKIFTKKLDRGGLKYANKEIFSLVLNCELIYNKFHHFILRNSIGALIKKIVQDINISFPKCCCSIDMKSFVVEHFFKIKLYGSCSIKNNLKRKSIMYGTSAPKRKKV